MVVDLTGLPATASAIDWAPTIPGEGTLSSIHNIWIDEFGYAYLAGSNLNNGGMIYADVFTDPGSPIFAGLGPAIYSHDVFTRDNIMYSSEIYDGIFSIYDVTDKENSITMGSHPTEAAFTHNAWLSDDSNTLYTTDEVAGASIGSYDVSDPSDVQELDQFRPFETLGDGVIPHNVHVWGDWLIVSYYTDGCIILDGSNPTNLVEVGNFDTFLPPSTGFSGAWGAYPYLPSGLILISDIGNGMYVLEPNYVNACWLEGTITDASNGTGVVGATISIQGTIITDESQAMGTYATGYAVSGTYDILVEKAGYASETVSAVLENGVITMLDVELQPLNSFAASGQVLDGNDNSAIEGAVVTLTNVDFNYELTSDAAGNITLNGVFPGTYQVSAGQWGYVSVCEQLMLNEDDNTFTLTMLPGIFDDFSVDLGWTTTSTAESGDWVREEPIGTSGQGQDANPGADVSDDCFGYAYVTGNGGGGIGNDDVDAGVVILTSPEFEVSLFVNTVVSYYRWFANFGGQGTPNDLLEVYLFNDDEEFLLESLDTDDGLDQWEYISHNVSALPLTGDYYRIRFVTSDLDGSGHVVEAAIDQFGVDYITGLEDFSEFGMLEVQPNPSAEQFTLSYELAVDMANAQLVIYDELSREVDRKKVIGQEGSLRFGADLPAGVYLIRIEGADHMTATQRLIKL